MKNKKNINPRHLALIGIMAAITCILGPLSLPIGVVPITFTNLAIYLAIYVLGWKKGTISYLIYLLIGFVGVPVFSGFSGGVGKLVGPTGGYLIGFIFMALISGIFIDKFFDKIYMHYIGMILGTIVTYMIGTAWLASQIDKSFGAALAIGVSPFILGDSIKIVIASLIGPILRKQLIKARLYK
ncbi:MAG: biotin biosynthesis protein BioY [Clostridiales bacterium]|nr:biotin biosynthesis protein BioY [Clostridiales bacterium]